MLWYEDWISCYANSEHALSFSEDRYIIMGATGSHLHCASLILQVPLPLFLTLSL